MIINKTKTTAQITNDINKKFNAIHANAPIFVANN